MKTKAIVATLLVAAAASADARFAWSYPRRAVSPDERGDWIVITSNAWPHSAESELTTFADGQLAVARRVLPVADRTRKNRRQLRKKRHSSRLGCFILVCGTSPLRHGGRIRSCRQFLAVKQTNDTHNAYEIDASEVQNSSSHRHSCEFALRG
jgi:hypothetical protein